MSPAKEPFSAPFSELNLTKQSDLSQKNLFYEDKQGNIFPYYKKDIYSIINVFKPCTFFPIFKELDIPFLEEYWLYYLEKNIQKGYEKEKLAQYTFGKYYAWCRLHDNKNNGFKDSNKFFINWLTGSDYENFHYIYIPPYWGISYKAED